ncbi:MAG: restriction endonuclease subunit S [Gallionella sp.]|nr:restriction endonuclease subunit S [Gallionella sp.]
MNSIQTLLTEHLDIWTSALLTKSTAGRGSNGKLEAYGIKKLRELILELAVRGKLVPQDLNDEPASDLLKKIAAEKSRLIAEGKVKKDKPLPQITKDEKPYELPHGWVWVRLGQVVEVLDGFRKPVTKQDREPGPYPYYGASGIVDYVSNFIFDEPLVLVGEDGAKWGRGDTTAFLISGKTWVNNHAHVIRPYRLALIDDFVALSLNAMDLGAFITGMTVPKLNQARLVSIVLPLPAIAEQHRIVAKVDELMALCDQLEQQQTDSLAAHQTLVASLLGTLTRVASQQEFGAAWARIASHFDTLFATEASIDQLKQTILQLAVMGKLTEKHDNWNVASLNDVCESIVDCPHSTPKFQLSGMVCIDTTCFKQGVLQRERLRYVSEESFHERNKRLYPRSGDIVFAREGSIGESVIIPDGIDACLGQRVMLLRPSHTMLSRYLRMAISSPGFLEQILHHHKGVGAKHINVKDVRSATIPLPPLAEQHRIVAKVDELMALCDTLKARLADAQAIQLHLADAIVEQAVC